MNDDKNVEKKESIKTLAFRLIKKGESGEEIIRRFFRYYFTDKRVGIVMCVTGGPAQKTGCGKSYTALRLGEIIDEDFNIQKVVYTPSEFLRVVDYVEEKGKTGQVIVVDEGEITAPAQLWYSFTNRAIAYTLATFRYLRSMAIFVVPSLSWLDKRIRLLTNFVGFTEKTVIGRKVEVYLDLRQVKTDLWGEKIFYSKIRLLREEDYKLITLTKLKMSLPSEKLIEKYEEKSTEFKKTLRSNLLIEIEKFKKYEGMSENELNEIIKKLSENEYVIDDLTQKKGKVSTSTIRMLCPELPSRTIHIIKRTLEKMWKGKGDD